VLDHVAKAPRGRDEHAAWERGVAALAELPNVTCKLSGLFTEADPEGTVARALRWFGPARCMWGSDWPVCTVVGDYADGLALVGDDPRVLGETAIATYRLGAA
jgi:L-fuconolactonase